MSSCRALPRGMKRHYTGKELQDLKDSLDPNKAKTKEENEQTEKKNKDSKNPEMDAETKSTSEKPVHSDTKASQEKLSSSEHDATNKDSSFGNSSQHALSTESNAETSLDIKSVETTRENELIATTSSKLLSPNFQSKPDSSSTPRSEACKLEMGSPHFSPVSKPDSQVQNSPDIQSDLVKGNSSWSLGQFKTTPTHKSEASPLNRESHSKIKQCKMIEQCSPTTSQENKQSPENVQNIKQDMKNPNSWNYGSYSPMPRQDSQFSQHSPYSAQPSPAQPSPYSAQPSPYSTQPSPYSSQPSPYSAQPSPDTSQMVKPELQKSSGQWNTGNYSPITKHPTPFSPHPSTHSSPDPGLSIKGDTLRTNPNKTPGQYSPMSRQDRLLQSPYSPRPSVDNTVYSNKKSPGMGNYSPGQPARVMGNRQQDLYNRSIAKVPEVMSTSATDMPSTWGLDNRFGLTGTTSATIDPSLSWGTSTYTSDSMTSRPVVDNIPGVLNTPPPQGWSGLPSFDRNVRRTIEEISDPWNLVQFRVEPPHPVHNNFVEQNVNFDTLSGHIGHQSHIPNYLDDSYSETSRVD